MSFRLALASLWIWLAAAPAVAISFLPLGDLPGGPTRSVANGISADGSTVVGESAAGGTERAPQTEPIRWTLSGGIESISTLPTGVTTGRATSASADGSRIIGRFVGGLSFEWTAATGPTPLFPSPGPQAKPSATDISADGSALIGGYQSLAFRWTDATGLVSLGDLPGGNEISAATDLSADGSVVVGRSQFRNAPHIGFAWDQPFRWTEAGGIVGLGFPDGYDDFQSASGEALGVSGDGRVIVGWVAPYDYFMAAFRWTEDEGYTLLGSPLGLGLDSFHAAAASHDGSVIVGTLPIEADNGADPFVWDPIHGLRNLEDLLEASGVDLAGWDLREAIDVSADGLTIVGNGIDPNGNRQGWIAFIPEPGTALLLGSGLAALHARRRSS